MQSSLQNPCEDQCSWPAPVVSSGMLVVSQFDFLKAGAHNETSALTCFIMYTWRSLEKVLNSASKECRSSTLLPLFAPLASALVGTSLLNKWQACAGVVIIIAIIVTTMIIIVTIIVIILTIIVRIETVIRIIIVGLYIHIICLQPRALLSLNIGGLNTQTLPFRAMTQLKRGLEFRLWGFRV